MVRAVSRRSRNEDEYMPDDDEREEETPRRGRGRRRSETRDEEEETPRSGFKGPKNREKMARSAPSAGGWDNYDKVKKERPASGDYVENWKVPAKKTLVKILESAPFLNYSEHWLDDLKGKKSWPCIGMDCPLCNDLGDRPKVFSVFNIVDLSDPDEPSVWPWKVSPTVADVLREYSKDKRTSPIDREDLYFQVYMGGDKKGNKRTQIQTVKARDLEEDWDVEPLSQQEIEDLREQCVTEEQYLTMPDRRTLKKLVEELDD